MMNISEIFLLLIVIYLLTVYILRLVIKEVDPELAKDNFMIFFACIPVLNTVFLIVLGITYIAGYINGWIKHNK